MKAAIKDLLDFIFSFFENTCGIQKNCALFMFNLTWEITKTFNFNDRKGFSSGLLWTSMGFWNMQNILCQIYIKNSVVFFK